MKRSDPCPTCGGTEWTPIPDSLAEYCQCGFVRVLSFTDHDECEPGATLQQWAADLAAAKEKKAVKHG